MNGLGLLFRFGEGVKVAEEPELGFGEDLKESGRDFENEQQLEDFLADDDNLQAKEGGFEIPDDLEESESDKYGHLRALKFQKQIKSNNKMVQFYKPVESEQQTTTIEHLDHEREAELSQSSPGDLKIDDEIEIKDLTREEKLELARKRQIPEIYRRKDEIQKLKLAQGVKILKKLDIGKQNFKMLKKIDKETLYSLANSNYTQNLAPRKLVIFYSSLIKMRTFKFWKSREIRRNFRKIGDYLHKLPPDLVASYTNILVKSKILDER